MSKEINVKMKMWETAHALEAEAMKQGDKAACLEATEEKARLAGMLFTAQEAGTKQPDATTTPGLGKGLAAIMGENGGGNGGTV